MNQTTTTLKPVNNTTLTSPVVTMKYTYDWLGRMRTMTFPKVVDNSWNIATGDGEVVTFTYDQGGMLDKISGKATPTSTAENYVNDIGYDEYGSRANLVSGNGITTAYTYTPTRHWLSTVTASGKASGGTTVQFLNASYSYDRVGNITAFNNAVATSAIQPNGATVGVGPLTITNTYDPLNQLVGSSGRYHGKVNSGQSYSASFAYAANGNITTKSQVDNPLTYASATTGLSSGTAGTAFASTTYTLKPTFSTTKPHQPTTVAETNSTNSTSTRTVSYDADGNFTGDSIGSTTRSLTWDEADRLKSVTTNGTVRARYQYSPEGERTQKQDAVAATTSFYFNQFLVINGSRQMTKNIFAGETRIASKTESAQLTTPVRSFYHPDNVGSTSYVSDANQNLVQHERYFPFGERWSSPDEVVTAGNIQRDYLFTGKELDRDTGFYYYCARYMDPRTSTWLSTDPILDSYMKGRPNDGAFEPRNLSLYSYSWNTPVTVKDPDGKTPVSVLIAACAADLPACAGAAAAMAGMAWIASRSAQNAPAPRSWDNVPPVLPPLGVPPSQANAPVDLMSLTGSPVTESQGTTFFTPAGAARTPSILQSSSQSPTITPADLTDKTDAELRKFAAEKGLVPDAKRADKWRDPFTNKERLRIDAGHSENGKPYEDPKAAVRHVHGYDAQGKVKVRNPTDNNPHFPVKTDGK